MVICLIDLTITSPVANKLGIFVSIFSSTIIKPLSFNKDLSLINEVAGLKPIYGNNADNSNVFSWPSTFTIAFCKKLVPSNFLIVLFNKTLIFLFL
ncbi:Uncharacterised protein [Chlamydia abortus]|nr:Uncharacterised protein [Chlamydia abortus]